MKIAVGIDTGDRRVRGTAAATFEIYNRGIGKIIPISKRGAILIYHVVNAGAYTIIAVYKTPTVD